MQKQKEKVMQPVTMAILIAIVFLSELPSFSARINSSSPPVILGNRVSPKAAETLDEDPPTYFVKIPVSGNIYSKGFYYVKIKIGSQTYKLDIDTGSDLTWFPTPEGQDKSQSMRYVRRDEPRCRDVLDSTTGEEEYTNGSEGEYENGDLCDFQIIYQDGHKSKGLVVTDTFALPLRGGSSISPTLAIGAKASSRSETHGMLGLGKGKISILSQLQEQRHFANIFGHCLSRNPGVQGFMFIGKDFDYHRCFTWVPMSSDSPHYSLTMAGVAYGHEHLLGSNNQVFVLDSGTTYTYLEDSLYQRLLSKVAEVPLVKLPGGDGKPPCWKDTRPFKSIHHLRSRFSSSIYLRLQDGKALQIPPENYLIINEAGDVCLGILNSLNANLGNINLIGAISMQNVMITYNNELQQIGWARVAGCSDPLARICK